ncbi:helix-turn-helix transcriptional regulator [Paraburkholderia sp. EG287A]|uniref:helix-turn-helix transcriptional regulator n=1 Tax=Paraburkholderia sp. EG287A TaxID=3237012 RepID=UPI0034D24E31
MTFVSAIFTPLYPEYRSPRATRKSDRYADVCRRLCEAHRDDIAPAGGTSADGSARTPRTRAPAKRAAKKSANSDDGGDGDGPSRPRREPLFYDLRDVADVVALSEGNVQALVRSGSFPKPRELSARRVGWLVSEIRAWAESRPLAEMLPPVNAGLRQAT